MPWWGWLLIGLAAGSALVYVGVMWYLGSGIRRAM